MDDKESEHEYLFAFTFYTPVCQNGKNQNASNLC